MKAGARDRKSILSQKFRNTNGSAKSVSPRPATALRFIHGTKGNPKMKSQYMQMKLFLAVCEHSELEKQFKTMNRHSPEFRKLLKRYDDLRQEIHSIYAKTATDD
jgi:hypothetical protein